MNAETRHEILRDWRDDLRTGRAFQGTSEVLRYYQEAA